MGLRQNTWTKDIDFDGSARNGHSQVAATSSLQQPDDANFSAGSGWTFDMWRIGPSHWTSRSFGKQLARSCEAPALTDTVLTDTVLTDAFGHWHYVRNSKGGGISVRRTEMPSASTMSLTVID